MMTSIPARAAHRTATRMIATGALAGALVAGTSALGAVPAAADPNKLAVAVNPGQVSLQVGGQPQGVTVQISSGRPIANARVRITVPLTDKGVTIAQGPQGCVTSGQSTLDCQVGAIDPQRPQQLTLQLAPPGQSDIKDGDNPSGSGDVEAQADDATASGTFQVTLAGKKQQSVGPVSGKVADQKSDQPLPNATVTIADGAGHSEQVTTGQDGTYSWQPSDGHMLAPGQLTITATASNYQQGKQTAAGQDGQPVSVQDVLLAPVATTPSATTAPTQPSVKPTTTPTKNDTGLGPLTWLMIILGALLVIGGIIAIIVLVKKKDKGDDEDGPDGPDGPYGPGGHPAGGYPDAGATAVINRVPGADAPTMVHGGPLVPPGGAAAPDEFDDYDNFARNYGTSSYRPGGTPPDRYGEATRQWGQETPSGAPTRAFDPTTATPSDPYGEPTRQAQPPSDPYGESTRQWGQQPSQQPSQQPAPSDRYGEQTRSWQQNAPGPSSAPPAYGPTSAPPASGSDAGRHRVDDPTRAWQQQPPQDQRNEHDQGPSRPSHDETRLERRDGVDWLDG